MARNHWITANTARWRAAALACAAGIAVPVLVLSAALGDAPGKAPHLTANANAPIQPFATLQELMRYEVDANADPIWDAVGTIIDHNGPVERQPHTDAEWDAVRQHAIVLLEATNLLVIPGRKVSAKPFPSDGPGVYSSAQIQQRLDEHRGEFNARALALREIVIGELDAIDKRDVVALQALGEGMDAACEACHLDHWYPHEIVPNLPYSPKPPVDAERHAKRDD